VCTSVSLSTLFRSFLQMADCSNAREVTLLPSFSLFAHTYEVGGSYHTLFLC